MPEVEYHAHSALSSTEARIILRKGGPARYRWAKDHPPLIAPSKKYDLGTAVHTKVLGTGSGVAVIPDKMLAANGAASTKAAKEFIEDARANGFVPLKQDEYDTTDRMAEGVLAHPTARALFLQPGGREVSVFGTDPETGVALRARFDFLPELTLTRPIAFDLKSTASEATPDDFGKAAANFGYDVQGDHYDVTLVHSGEPGNRPEFVFVVVEKDAPHLVAVLQLPEALRDRGRRRARRAREIYAECLRTGQWPGHPDDVQFVNVPNWVLYEESDDE